MNTLTICRKELQSYFRSPIAYGVMAFFALIGGFFFYVARVVLRAAQHGKHDDGAIAAHGRQRMDRAAAACRTSTWSALFLIPMITMRLFAEEKRTGTIELLMTSPISDLEIMIGKWLAAVMLYASCWGFRCSTC